MSGLKVPGLPPVMQEWREKEGDSGSRPVVTSRQRTTAVSNCIMECVNSDFWKEQIKSSHLRRRLKYILPLYQQWRLKSDYLRSNFKYLDLSYITYASIKNVWEPGITWNISQSGLVLPIINYFNISYVDLFL